MLVKKYVKYKRCTVVIVLHKSNKGINNFNTGPRERITRAKHTLNIA